MSKKARTMLILSCVFVTITAVLLFLDSYVSFSCYSLLFGSDPQSLGEALGVIFGGILLFVYTILLGIGILFSGIATLPFNIILLKENGKKWYSLTILIFTIVAMVMAIAFVAMLPVVSRAQEAVKAANSSSNIESTEALILTLL